jgi:uncharacterized protein (DUF697 family)
MTKSIAELDAIRRECRRLVTTRSLAAAAVSVVPIPGVDIAADVGLLTSILTQVNERFGLSEKQIEKLDPGAAEQVLLLAAGLGNGVIGRAVSKQLISAVLKRVAKRLAVGSAAKFVPFAGSALAAGLGFSAMKLAGNAHVEDCYRTARALLDGQAAAGEAGRGSAPEASS